MRKVSPAFGLALIVILVFTSVVSADVLNGGFETGNFTGWVTHFDTRNLALTGSAPYTGANVPAWGGGGTAKTWVLGPFAQLSQNAVNTASGLKYPAYGSYSAKINDETSQYHANWIDQTFTIDALNLDSVDGLYHLRMVVAPVLEAQGHSAPDQPFFWVRVTNNTTSTILYDDVFVPGDPNIPWLTGASGWVYLNWVLIDVKTGLSNGDNVTVKITAADCDAGGHGGYALVDGIGGKIPGPVVSASGIASTIPNTNIIYTFNYQNNGASTANGTQVTVYLPIGTTFVSADPGCSGTGPVTCPVGALAAGGSGSFQVTVHVPSGTPTPSTITEGNYNISSTNFPMLTGPAVFTDVIEASPSTTSISSSVDPSFVGQSVTFTATVISPSGTPQGTVAFTADGTDIFGCTSVLLNGSGQATCTTSTLTVGTHPINATYSGATDFPGSSGTLPGGQVVEAAAVAAAATLPSTGFSPGVNTTLPIQSFEKAYLTLGDLWLEIPTLGIQTSIIGVPSTKEGWDTTWLGNQVGWLQGTAFPTWKGNSVLTGHVWNADNTPGIFINMEKLLWGDKIVVHAWGQEYIYEVRTIRKQVKPEAVALALKHEEYPWLTLVTCSGYNERSESYRYRTIIKAVQVSVK